MSSPELVTTLQDFKIVQVVCGYNHTAALSEDGYVFTWGYGGNMFHPGALGNGDYSSQPTPVVVDYLYDTGIKIVKLASGSTFMVALSDTGELYSWGDGSSVCVVYPF